MMGKSNLEKIVNWTFWLIGLGLTALTTWGLCIFFVLQEYELAGLLFLFWIGIMVLSVLVILLGEGVYQVMKACREIYLMLKSKKKKND